MKASQRVGCCPLRGSAHGPLCLNVTVTRLFRGALTGNSWLIHDAAKLTTFLCLIKAFCERDTHSGEGSDGRVSRSGLTHGSSGSLLLAVDYRGVGSGSTRLHFKVVPIIPVFPRYAKATEMLEK